MIDVNNDSGDGDDDGADAIKVYYDDKSECDINEHDENDKKTSVSR